MPHPEHDDNACSSPWDASRRELAEGAGDGDLNIARVAVDRHVAAGRGGDPALRWIDRRGEVHVTSWSGLQEQSNRFANVLSTLGLAPGERVFTLCGRIPELFACALGTFKHRGVFSSLFSAYGPEPVRVRLELGDARVLVTTEKLYARKVAPLRGTLPRLQHILIVRESDADLPPGTLDLRELLAAAPTEWVTPPTAAEDPALLHFTSGTTGTPKGVVHVHEAVIAHHLTGKVVLGVRPGDVYWCTADPGWVTGVSYGIVAPLVLGVTLIVDEDEFDAERWYRLLQDQKVNVWYTAPTAIRMLRRLGPEVAARHDFSALRQIASVGEPLSAGAVRWGEETFGRPILDTWWQTETGAIMIAHRPGMEGKPGAMGLPIPGIEAAILDRGAGAVTRVEPGAVGELALRAPWPSMFRAYLGMEERFRACFAEGWYFSGDLARQDEDGYFWFIGRKDDVIKSAGHLIGPVEVETALMEHPAVAEAGVIGRPDPMAGAVVKAFVALKPGFEPGEALERELLGHARLRLGPAVAPREIAFREALPKTRSGKIMRRRLLAQELGEEPIDSPDPSNEDSQS